jgi:NodT family efflux transporter outer membrane factor (OMF) lipoprotein
MNERPSRIRAPRAAALAAILAGGACTVGPDFEPPAPSAPASWAGVGPTDAASHAESVTTAKAAELEKWWERFQDPELTALVENALRTNLDVEIAKTRLREAVAARGVVAGGLWPDLNASGSYQRVGVGGTPQNSFQAGLNASWVLDVFGGVRRGVESADATIALSEENIRDVQVILISEVALNYIQLRSFQEQIAIGKENIKSQQHTADLTEQKSSAGFVSHLDVANANAQVAATTAVIPVLQTLVEQNIYALSVLLGRPPADLLVELSTSAPVPLTPPEIPVGLPSDLLRRRPDIRAAEASLHAATAQIGVAVSALFPQFSLTGLLNYQSSLLGDLFSAGSRIWSVGPQASWSLLQGGSLVSNVRLQEALRDEAFITYKKTVLTALQDVESALVAFSREWDHRKALSDAVAYNRSALDLSDQLYRQGATDFLNVLNAERSLFVSQIALAQSNQSIATDLVALYRALGGGWEEAGAGA